MPFKRVRIHYRRFYPTSEPAIDGPLSAAVLAALRKPVDGIILDQDVSLRTYTDGDYGNVVLNGRFLPPSGDVYGEMVRVDPEANITLLVQGSADRSEFEVRTADKPNGTEILRGMSFFLIRGDHVLTIEQELTNPIFERYLRWLLCTQAAVARKDARMQLVPQVFLDHGQQMLRTVRSITFKPPKLKADELQLGHRTYKTMMGLPGAAVDILEVLKAAHFNTSEIERLAAENNAAVQIQLNVSLKSGRENVQIQGEEALSLLRNVPEEDLILQGNGARKNRGIIERLSVLKDVERKGNILDRNDAWRALREAAAAYRDAGLIE